MRFGSRWGQRGVTLLEIIVVLLIVSVGAGMVYPSMQGAMSRRRADGAIAVLRKVTECLGQYKITYGSLSGIKYSAIYDNGCLDADLFPKDYDFTKIGRDQSIVSSLTIVKDKVDLTRYVCMYLDTGSLANSANPFTAVYYDMSDKNKARTSCENWSGAYAVKMLRSLASGTYTSITGDY